MEKIIRKFNNVLGQHGGHLIENDYVVINGNLSKKHTDALNGYYKISNIDSEDEIKNNSNFIIKSSHILGLDELIDDNKDLEISLNRKQRTLLNVEQYKEKEGGLFNQGKYSIQIEKIDVKSHGNVFNKIVDSFLSYFVGKKNILLTVKRPYTIDENFNIVRMSKINMQILGIKEMDRVRIWYCDNYISANVLSIDDKESFKYCNLDTLDNDSKSNKKLLTEEYCILMPIHLREILFGGTYSDNRANVKYNLCVKVERDNYYIFMKSFYKQMIPLVLAIFSFTELLPIFIPVFSNKMIVAAASILGAILTLYINLAEERNICK